MSTYEPTHAVPRISVKALGWSLGLFFAIVFSICVAFGLLFPGATMYQAWLALFPWVTWMSWPSFWIGPD